MGGADKESAPESGKKTALSRKGPPPCDDTYWILPEFPFDLTAGTAAEGRGSHLLFKIKSTAAGAWKHRGGKGKAEML